MIVVGVAVCFAWYYTIISGFFLLYCPVLYLLFINHKLYRKLSDVLFALWEFYPVGLFQCCCGTKLHHYGDYVHEGQNSIVIANHRTRVDWNYLWIAMYHAIHKDSTNREHNDCNETIFSKLSIAKCKTKIVLKDELKNVPGLGWIMQMNYFLYVKRDWNEDQRNLTQFVNYYSKLGAPYKIIMFPEGTDFSVENKSKSDRFAVINTLPLYDFVLHPRTTGWCSLITKLREADLKYIYDVTLAYDNPPQTELSLIKGMFPKHVHVHIKKYLITEMPSDDLGLKNWLNEKWAQKEQSLRYLQTNGTFKDSTTGKPPAELIPKSLKKAVFYFIFWTIIDIIFTNYLISNVVFQIWVFCHSLFFIIITKQFGGFHTIQYKLFMNEK